MQRKERTRYTESFKDKEENMSTTDDILKEMEGMNKGEEDRFPGPSKEITPETIQGRKKRQEKIKQNTWPGDGKP